LPEGRLSPDFVGKLKQFRGVQGALYSGRYERTETLRRAIREIGYHAVLTLHAAGDDRAHLFRDGCSRRPISSPY